MIKLSFIKIFLFVLFFLYNLYLLKEYSSFTHFDEWVGRGLYPGIAIYLAYTFNICSTIILLCLILFSFEKHKHSNACYSVGYLFIIPFIFIYLMLFDEVSHCIINIHSDFPAFFFMGLAAYLFNRLYKRLNINNMLLVSLLMCFSVWSKLPTLPAVIFPIIVFAFWFQSIFVSSFRIFFA